MILTNHTTPVFFLFNLQSGYVLPGPAIIIDKPQTIVVDPKATATILSRHVILHVQSTQKQTANATVWIFDYRFMSAANKMSRMFRRPVSTNTKERFDFSCAVFFPDKKRVANAPNVPVHLGIR
jgi:5-oxoprolinase (ATP-hydrolysing)